MVRPFLSIAAIAMTFGICAAACSMSDDPAGSHSDGTDRGDAGNVYVKCDDDRRVIPYTDNMVVESAHKTFKLTIVSANPRPPAKNSNVWKIRVTDPSGAPFPDATVTVPPPFMPDHGHGSSVTPSVEFKGEGNYDVGVTSPLHFFMPGVWRITINVKLPSAVPDTVEFFFCVPG